MWAISEDKSTKQKIMAYFIENDLIYLLIMSVANSA